MSKKLKGKKIPQKGKRKEEEEYEEDEEIDLINFPTKNNNDNNDKNEIWYMIICASVVSAVYISTLFPSVPGGTYK